MTYGYDNANRLSSVTDWNSNAIAYAYDDAGRMTTKTLPTGTGVVSNYTYDNADRLTAIGHVKGGSTTIASVAYTLDDVGNRTQRVDQQGTHTYAYDDLYRLTSVTYPGPSTTSYTFDAFGNRLTKTDASGTTNSTYDDADRLTSVDPPGAPPAVTHTWDNNGNLTARGSDSFSWDYEDRMTSATVASATTTFAYRGDGLRNSRTTGGTTTTFTWDIAAGLPVVLDDGAKYVYGAGLESQTSGSNTYYYLADGLGSTMKTVDATGTVVNAYEYDVYGKKTTSSGTQPNEFDFAGQQTDPTGLQYLRARYDDPDVGGFLSRDPLAGSPGWLGQPFGYAEANPATLSDPTGLWCPGCGKVANGAKAVGGGIQDGAGAAVDGAKAAGSAVGGYATNKANDTKAVYSDTQNHPSSVVQNLVGLAVSLGTTGDRHEGPGDFYWYDNASGLGALIPDMFGQTTITLGNGSFSNDTMDGTSRLWWHEYTHDEQSTEHGWTWILDYLNGGPHDTNPFETEASDRGRRCAGSMSCPEKP